ncbi:MAG: tRNA (guanine-N(7)-)-methyltransferase [bacterium]|nr:MAG: tRNA (guanine-N(7)-)-methyltransferase [bacterium]
MRQRKVKDEEEKLAKHHQYTVANPKEYKGRWLELFNNQNEIYIEVGCGKGKFILTLAEQNPDKNYIAVEGRGSIILRALEKATLRELNNIIFLREYIRDIEDYFKEGEISGVYLNFSDPWPKDRHAKRRLTHSRYLEGYKRIIKPGYFIEFKTDNDELFKFALEEFTNNDMQVLDCTVDLHNTDLPAKCVTTEYEDKFNSTGKNINYCKVRIK